MPIDGLTDIDRPPRQGMLRLGIKKKTADGKKEYPAEVDYLILDPETPDVEQKKKIIDKFFVSFGINPKAIEIRLLSSDINTAFPQNYKRYGKNTPLKCIGDGKEAVVTEKEWGRGLDQVGTDDRGYMKVRCDGRDCIYSATNEKAQNKECKATATLNVKIHQLGGLGVWQLTTGSFNSIVNINSSIRDLVKTYGRAHDIPLMLERRPQETAYKGKKTIHYTLHINEAPGTLEAVKAFNNGNEIDINEKPDEILDGEAVENAEIDRLADQDKEKPIVVNHPPVDMEKPEPPQGAVQENTKPADPETMPKATPHPATTAPDVQAATDKVTEAFDGKVVDESEMSKKQSQTFLDGCADEAKEELGADTLRNEAKFKFPDRFAPFMVLCKKKLEEADMDSSYREVFRLYSIKTAADLEKDVKKQGQVRVYLEALLEEKGLV